MIIVPEIETVVILTPRTGSGSLKRALLAAYPKAMALYRHMEADGVPAGYDRWRRVGVVRHPVDRLWSLFKFCQRGNCGGNYGKYPELWDRLNRSVDRPFEDWLLNNEVVFTSPYDSAGRGRFWPGYTVRHPLPENRKSQFFYLRPDLGTDVYHFDRLGELERDLGVTLPLRNQTVQEPAPTLTDKAADHIRQVFAWDLDAVAERKAA